MAQALEEQEEAAAAAPCRRSTVAGGGAAAAMLEQRGGGEVQQMLGCTPAAGGSRRATCVDVVEAQLQAEAEVPMAATWRGGAAMRWKSPERAAEAAGAGSVAGGRGGMEARSAYSVPAALLE